MRPRQSHLEGRRSDGKRDRRRTAAPREAAAAQGRVSDLTWASALAAGWNDEQLAEAFSYLGLAVFTAYFLNYAGTELDLPART